MGYYTSYALSLYGNDSDCKAFERDLLELSKDDNGEYDFELKELIEMGGVYAKLYDLVAWITDLAPKYPSILITLSGNGEEFGDLWEERWKGSDHEFHEAKIPRFRNKNLQI